MRLFMGKNYSLKSWADFWEKQSLIFLKISQKCWDKTSCAAQLQEGPDSPGLVISLILLRMFTCELRKRINTVAER